VDWSTNWSLGLVELWTGNPDAAAAAIRRGIVLAPNLPLQHSFLAFAEIARGEYDEAGRELELNERLLGPNRTVISLIDTAYGYGRIGRSDDARRVFNESEALAADQDIGAGGWAAAYLAIGDEAAALESLRQGAEKARNKVPDAGIFTLMNLRMNATADPVPERPEFVAVRRQLTGE
jgi:Flp pilus assembly protein TadD